MRTAVYIYSIPLISQVRGPYEDPLLAVRTEQMRLEKIFIIWLCSSDYCGKGTKLFDVLTGDQELEVHKATYGPEINQSQRAKSVGHLINH